MTMEEIRLKAVEYAFKKDAVSKEVITAYISGYVAASHVGAIKGDTISFLESLEFAIRYNGKIKNVRSFSEEERETVVNDISRLRRTIKGNVYTHLDEN